MSLKLYNLFMYNSEKALQEIIVSAPSEESLQEYQLVLNQLLGVIAVKGTTNWRLDKQIENINVNCYYLPWYEVMRRHHDILASQESSSSSQESSSSSSSQPSSSSSSSKSCSYHSCNCADPCDCDKIYGNSIDTCTLRPPSPLISSKKSRQPKKTKSVKIAETD